MSVKILTDSTSYINENLLKTLDIERVCLNITFENESYKETEISNDVFYKKMDEKGIPTSSQPSVSELQEKMTNIINNGNDLLCIFLSSKMSGTYSTAHLVKNLILEDNKDAKIEIIDSKSNCMQLGFTSILAAKAANEGKSLKEVKNIAEENIKRSRFLFIPDNLTYLQKGGRIGNAGALIGNFLKIIPILTVENGETTVLTKIRTKKRAISTMVDKMLEDIENYGGLGDLVIHHINCFDEALELSQKIKEKINIDIEICDIGPVIGLHVGPGAIGIVYYTNNALKL